MRIDGAMNGKKKRSTGGLLLLAAGVLLCAYALLRIACVTPLAQYALIAPEGEGALSAKIAAWDEKKESVRETAPHASLYTVGYGTAVSKGTDASATATTFGVDAEFFAAHPAYILSGRLFDPAEMEDGVRVAVLDETLAFKLFPGADPEGEKVYIGETEYQVAGVVRAKSMPGDSDECAVYVPLRTIAKDNAAATLLVADCVAERASASRALEETAKDALGDGGSMCFVKKEAMRQTMLLRLFGVAFGFTLLIRLLRVVNARLGKEIAARRGELRDRYLRGMLPGILGKGALFLLAYAALAAACWGLMSLLTGPMYMFTEWIPDVFVDWSSISARGKELFISYAQPVVVRTREGAALALYGTLLRWGMLMALSGALIHLTRVRRAA